MNPETVKQTNTKTKRFVKSIKITDDLRVTDLTDWISIHMQNSFFSEYSKLKNDTRIITDNGVYVKIVSEEEFQENYIDIEEFALLFDHIYMSDTTPADIFSNYAPDDVHAHMNQDYILDLVSEINGGNY